MSDKKPLRYDHTDNGFCRVYFTRVSDVSGRKLWYCLQDEGANHGGVKAYRCTDSEWLEPEYEIKPEQFSYPTWVGDTETDKAAREMIAAINN